MVGEATSIVGLGPVSRLPVNRASLVGTAFEPDKSAPVSITGVEFFKVFSSKEKNNIYLSTAARMSASFPYVSPAVNLPTDPPLRVVDAGYYDNYGVDLAASWLFANRKWIIENTSGVLIVQIRDAISTHDRFGYSDTNSNYANWLSGLQFFFSPVDAVLTRSLGLFFLPQRCTHLGPERLLLRENEAARIPDHGKLRALLVGHSGQPHAHLGLAR